MKYAAQNVAKGQNTRIRLFVSVSISVYLPSFFRPLLDEQTWQIMAGSIAAQSHSFAVEFRIVYEEKTRIPRESCRISFFLLFSSSSFSSSSLVCVRLHWNFSRCRHSARLNSLLLFSLFSYSFPLNSTDTYDAYWHFLSVLRLKLILGNPPIGIPS